MSSKLCQECVHLALREIDDRPGEGTPRRAHVRACLASLISRTLSQRKGDTRVGGRPHWPDLDVRPLRHRRTVRMGAYLPLTCADVRDRPRPVGLPRRTAWRARTEECLGVAAVVGVRTIPDQRLRCEIKVPWPRHGAVAGSDSAEQGVVRAQAVEDGAPQEVLDVALDDRSVSQREPKSASFERDGSSNTNHHGSMLPQRRDPPQRQTGLRELPVGQKLVGVQGRPFDHKGMCSR